MTVEEAKDFLTHYICCCPYGNSPINCDDDKCKFGIAVRTICEEERPQGKWISEDVVKPYDKCNQCGEICEVDNFCGNCGADMQEGKE